MHCSCFVVFYFDMVLILPISFRPYDTIDTRNCYHAMRLWSEHRGWELLHPITVCRIGSLVEWYFSLCELTYIFNVCTVCILICMQLHTMCLPSDLLWEFQIKLFAKEILCIGLIFRTRMFCRGVSDFMTVCPCGVWCHYQSLVSLFEIS